MFSANQVRRKEVRKSQRSKFYLLLTVGSLMLIGVIAFFVFGVFSNGFGLAGDNFEVVTENGRQIIRVPAGGNLQAAVNRANSGDIIELVAGATYNEITLPKKNLTDFVTIQTASAKLLPENKRVTPAQSKLMARITTRGGEKSAVMTADGAHHYRFVGIEFVPTGKNYVYNLVYLAASTDKLTDVPHDLEFDRCYFRSTNESVTRRGLALNSANTIVKNSYFEGFAFPQEETQGICGWTGTKNVKITNNYIEGGAENVMFGGSDPANAELIPQDIELTGNHFNKPAAWKGKNSMKCLFELKNAKRVRLVGNLLENNWLGAAFRITIRNDGGTAPFSTIEDVLIKDNIINGAGEGFNILGKDDVYPSQTMKRLTITNNLLLNIGQENYQGGGYFVQVSNGEDITISNNTSFNLGNITTFHGELPKNFVVRDNIIGHGNYGVHGFPNIKSPEAQKIFQNNVIVNSRNVSRDDTSFPSGNLWVNDYKSIGFVNFDQKDFNLAPTSKFKGKGALISDVIKTVSLDSEL